MKKRTIIAIATARVVERARLKTLAEAERAALEKAITDGKSAMRADYYRSIRAMADGIVAEFRDKDPYPSELTRSESESTLDELIHRAANDCYWTTFTHAHLQCLIASDKWLEGDDMEIPHTKSLTDTLLVYATYAVQADLREYVEPRLATGSDA